ncbi:PilN domain-containing protein [Tindallia californiensis]|uniref:Tfp pilus assembly protein PilN n=1 Tax=Tindallia californiensis TaxID=159292 RepID=A0A1H3NKA0_9FIRM|nr:PilN domain-containing protein [Tindallia californiensis]SDY88639.1 Tfp pilus assembly protein PilN [Tindallia californiensis]
MRDYNFFENYTMEPEKKPFKGLWGVVIVGSLCFLLVAWSVYGYIEIQRLENDIALVKDDINQLYAENDYDAIEMLEKDVDLLKKELYSLEKIKTSLENRKVITPYLIDLISRSVTDGIAFEALHIAENQIQIQGNSTHRTSIAQMKHNIRNSGHFNEIFVAHITEADTLYNFSISFQLKGGIENEIEQ